MAPGESGRSLQQAGKHLPVGAKDVDVTIRDPTTQVRGQVGRDLMGDYNLGLTRPANPVNFQG